MRRNEKIRVGLIKIVLIYWLWKKFKRPTILKVKRKKLMRLKNLKQPKKKFKPPAKPLLNKRLILLEYTLTPTPPVSRHALKIVLE